MDKRTVRVLEYKKVIDMLAEFTVSSMGKEKAYSLQPTNDKSLIEKWMHETTEAEAFIIGAGSDPLDAFDDIRFLLKRSRIGGILNPAELIDISKTLRTAEITKANVEKHKKIREDMAIIPSLAEKLEPHRRINQEILRCIESESHVSDQASPELASIRRHIRQQHEKIRQRLNNLIHSPQQQKYLQENIVTIRNDRYVVPVKQEHKANVPGLVHDESSSGATLFIEPMSVVEANNELREWIVKEEKEIQRILYYLTMQVEQISSDIEKNLEILAQMDFIFAKGKLSLHMKGIAPRIIDSCRVKIINGRHPLIKKDEVVPISLSLGEGFNTLVITGPNTGGKTVTLKTLGLFALMVQSGLHIPSDHGTEMGIFKGIFADIGDEQSIEQNLSTFSSHMTNIVNILSNVKQHSLVLLDELGAGTDPTEGAALAMGILTYLHEQNICTAATTHYSELKIFALNHKGVENASMEFNVETLQPTFRLLIGVPGKSNAFEISRRLGLMEDVINRAKEFLSQEDIRFEDIIGNMEYNRLKAEEERKEAQMLRNQLRRLKDELENEKIELKERQNKILQRAREEAKRILRDAKEESNQIIKNMQQLSKVVEEKERNRALEEARKNLRRINEIEERIGSADEPVVNHFEPPRDLKLGETVYVINLNQKGQVLTLPDQNGELQLQVGIMKVNSHISNLMRTKEQVHENKHVSKKISLRISTVKSELDLRGMNVEEALIDIDKYLDDVFLAGLNEVTIIHGKGTGVLRSGIHDHLRTHPHVKSFRLGKYGEGETGVTIVEIK